MNWDGSNCPQEVRRKKGEEYIHIQVGLTVCKSVKSMGKENLEKIFYKQITPKYWLIIFYKRRKHRGLAW